MARVLAKGKEELKEIAKTSEGRLIVLDFMAEWCPSCQKISPHFDEFAKENQDVICVKVDLDAHEELGEEFGAEIIPYFVFMKAAGGIVHREQSSDINVIKGLIAEHK